MSGSGIAKSGDLELFNPFDAEYHGLLRRILETGVKKQDRTGTGTLGVFGHMIGSTA